MKALHWLKQYHAEYRNDTSLAIDESNLDWMDMVKKKLKLQIILKLGLRSDINSEDANEEVECSVLQLQHTSLEESNEIEYWCIM